LSDDYLWDRSGPPDPEVARLERLLAPLRPSGPPPAFGRSRRPWLSSGLASAAAALLAVSAAWLALRDSAPGWYVRSVAGEPRLGRERLHTDGVWRVGQWLETDAVSRAVADAGEVGRVIIGPGSRARLVDAGAASHRLALAEGRLHAVVFAPPMRFFVETPSALAVDLGCEYTLETDASGTGLLRVRSGWVGFEWKGRETFVPAGARCRTWPRRGPGTPVFETASAEFREALDTLDAGPADAAVRAGALATVLVRARRRDAMSLWHLLARLPAPERVAVVGRLSELVPPPSGVSREALLSLDPAALDLWWNMLNLDDVTWWRQWKLGWPRADAAGLPKKERGRPDRPRE
jgi:hypothetical protein